MTKGDVVILTGLPSTGSRTFAVASGTTASINPGEFVLKSLGAAAVSALVSTAPASAPSVGTSFTAGLAMSISTETASAAGTVEVLPTRTDMVFLGIPSVAADWDTQTEYNLLVGDRVRMIVSAGASRIITGDDTSHAFVVEPLDVVQTPARVAFSLRSAANYNA